MPMISKGNYFAIFVLLLMVFVMFMFVGVSSNILSDSTGNIRAGERVNINLENTISANSLNLGVLQLQTGQDPSRNVIINPDQKLRVAILSEEAGDEVAGLLAQWCVYNKYFYKIYTEWPKEDAIADYSVILFGRYPVFARDSRMLYSYADQGKTMIFMQLPDYEEIGANREFAAFFGIKAAVEREVTADGIKLFSNFMINQEREYGKGDYFGEEDDTRVSLPYYSLSSGYEVYCVGILDNQEELQIEDKDLPPLLWRTTTRKSFVFSVNSRIFDGMSLLGLLTGFMAKGAECYIYPIVNAQTISLLGYPYLSNENSEVLQRLYSRSSEAVARDLLWPNIIQILKSYGSSYSFFAAPQLDYKDEVGALDHYIDFYLREIGKLPGDMGLSLGQVSDIGLRDMNTQNEQFFRESLPDYDFTALYAADFEEDEVRGQLEHELLKDVSLVMSDYRDGDQLISFLNDNTLSVKFNLDGYRHETMDDLRMLCIENALGMCNVRVDIGRVFYPGSSRDEWNNLSLKWSKGSTYFNDFDKLDMVSIYEMEKRVRRFLALDYIYECTGNDINIRIDHFDEEAYFILCTYSRSIGFVEGGSAKKISSSAYLIKAADARVRIHLIEENVLGKPKNNKIIPSNPKQD